MRYCDDNYRYNGRRGCDCCDCCQQYRPCPPPCPPPCPHPWPPCPPEPPKPPCPPPTPPTPRCPHDSAQFGNGTGNQVITAGTTGLTTLTIPVPIASDKNDITITGGETINLQPGRYLVSYALVARNTDNSATPGPYDTELAVGLKSITGTDFLIGTQMTHILLEEGTFGAGVGETEAISKTSILDISTFTQIQLAARIAPVPTATTAGAVTIYDASVTIVEICECPQA